MNPNQMNQAGMPSIEEITQAINAPEPMQSPVSQAPAQGAPDDMGEAADLLRESGVPGEQLAEGAKMIEAEMPNASDDQKMAMLLNLLSDGGGSAPNVGQAISAGVAGLGAAMSGAKPGEAAKITKGALGDSKKNNDANKAVAQYLMGKWGREENQAFTSDQNQLNRDLEIKLANDKAKLDEIAARNKAPTTKSIGGRVMGWNPETQQFDQDFGAETDKSTKLSFNPNINLPGQGMKPNDIHKAARELQESNPDVTYQQAVDFITKGMSPTSANRHEFG